tara:strand:+ start:974 stop:1276 length:303 start_codon:yes stop_codon:yes gene_type:complete
MKKIHSILICFILLVSCGGLSDAGKVLRNEKVKTTDEFLVKKREPLVLPPDYKNVPKPGENKSSKKNDQKIKDILKVEEEESKQETSSSVEDSILKKIGQ